MKNYINIILQTSIHGLDGSESGPFSSIVKTIFIDFNSRWLDVKFLWELFDLWFNLFQNA